jgi:hypothetical protein
MSPPFIIAYIHELGRGYMNAVFFILKLILVFFKVGL